MRVTPKTSRQRHKKIIKQAKGYYGAKSKQFRRANEAVIRSLAFSYKHRRQRKRDFRRLWISRINAAARLNGLSYSCLMSGLRQTDIQINRKILSELAINEPVAFSQIAEKAKQTLAAAVT